jgi:hypothetical protein
MESLAGEACFKDHTVSLFGGRMDFRVWREKIELYLMANGLWGFIDGEDTGDKKNQATRSLVAYTIISINLTDSARNVVRRLGSRDPKEVWNALLAEFDKSTPATKMALLDFLLGLRCTSTILAYVSDFQVTIMKLRSTDVRLDEDLTIAMVLRGLPQTFETFTNSVKHREKMPNLDKLFSMICLEEKLVAQAQGVSNTEQTVAPKSYVADTPGGGCPECGKVGHNQDTCWRLHPELAPLCGRCEQRGHSTRNCRQKIQRVSQYVEAESPPKSL